jgi:hypothetical protein
MFYVGLDLGKKPVPVFREEHTDDVGIHHHRPERPPLEEKAAQLKRGGEVYGSVEDYDPVLRAHCRL